VQICTSAQLTYYPRGVDLDDASRYDLAGPQRTVQQLARKVKAGYYDLRPVLKQLASDQCPYVPYNMHWTTAGHHAVARDVAAWLQQNRYLPERNQ
jgi:hypothetical protein